jgi:molybdate transport system ATP-binding protein
VAGALTVDVVRRFPDAADVSAAFDAPLGAGDVLVLFGPSGAGKTTVLRMIAGLERPDRGRIRFDGVWWFDDGRRVSMTPQRRRIGYVFQQPSLFPHLTVRANVEYGVDRPRAPAARAGVDRLLARLGIDHLADRSARRLSGGEAQRVALARALATRPQLLLLDEPLASVDAPSRAALRGDLRALLRESGVPAVLVTHDRQEVLALGDRLAVMADGRVRQVGAVSEVLSRPADAHVAKAVGVESVVPAVVVGGEEALLAFRVGSVTLNGIGDEALTPGRDVLACIRAEDVTIERRAASGTSARNHIVARIVAIDPEGPLDRVRLDAGFPLVALITRRSREELALVPGVEVTAAIKATAVHLVAR